MCIRDSSIEVMVADLLGVVENLLQVEVEIPLMAFRDHAFFAGELSEPGIRNRGGAGFVERNADVYKRQPRVRRLRGRRAPAR